MNDRYSSSQLRLQESKRVLEKAVPAPRQSAFARKAPFCGEEILVRYRGGTCTGSVANSRMGRVSQRHFPTPRRQACWKRAFHRGEQRPPRIVFSSFFRPPQKLTTEPRSFPSAWQMRVDDSERRSRKLAALCCQKPSTVLKNPLFQRVAPKWGMPTAHLNSRCRV